MSCMYLFRCVIVFWNSGELRMGRRGARTDEDFLPPPRTILNIYMYHSTQKYYLQTIVQYCMAGTYYLRTTIQYSMERRLRDNLLPRSFFLRLPNKDQTKTTKTVSLRSNFSIPFPTLYPIYFILLNIDINKLIFPHPTREAVC